MTTVTSGKVYYVNGTTQDNILVDSGGYLFVESSGVVSSTTVDGYAEVENHSDAYFTALKATGTLIVDSGGTEYDTNNSGGYEAIFTGATAEYGTVYGGGRQVVSGGKDVGTAIGSGGTQIVSLGQTTGVVVDSGGQQTLERGSLSRPPSILAAAPRSAAARQARCRSPAAPSSCMAAPPAGRCSPAMPP
jgi:autotransporter passenger strand-loop-strand repeat protein